jgi:molybdenum cofactor cytidylyltransferase
VPYRLEVDGIILAAGLSTRMGRPKLLLDLNGKAVVAHVVNAALESALRSVILVTGPSSDDTLRCLGDRAANARLRVVANPKPERGMSSSLQAGLKKVYSDALGVMVVLADQPRLTPDVIDRLITAFCQEPEKIIASTVHSRRTTPVLFPASLITELMETTGDVGGRSILNRYPHRVVECEVGPWYDDTDLDTPRDLEQLTRKAE